MRMIGVVALLWALQETEGTYTDEERGFSITIPKGWSVTRGTDRSKALILRAPPEARTGSTCIITLQDSMKAVFDGQVTLDQFLEEVKKQYPKKFADFEFGKAEKGKDGENPTLALTYRYTNSGQKIGQLQMLVWTRTQHWSLSFGCLADQYESQREFFERTSKSFKPGVKK
jgi:hypothetical protein